MFRHFYLTLLVVSTFFFATTHTVFANESEKTDSKPYVLLLSQAASIDDSDWYIAIDEYAKLAATDLELDLEHLALGGYRDQTLPILRQRLNKDPKPDYIVFANQVDLGLDILEMSDQYNIKSFLFMEPLTQADYESVNGPRGKFKTWLGQLIPNDEQTGYDLANFLIDEAKKQKEERDDFSDVKFAAISGLSSSRSAYFRQKGLMKALSEREDVEFLQSTSGRWLRDVASQKYLGLKRRYGQIDAIWCANDTMALGVVDALNDADIVPVIGSVDWIDPAIRALSEGKIAATMGGHAFDVAYVLALLKNYDEGFDFANQNGNYDLHSYLTPLTRYNLPEFENFLKYRQSEKVDFLAGFEGLTEVENLNKITIERFVKQSMTPVR